MRSALVAVAVFAAAAVAATPAAGQIDLHGGVYGAHSPDIHDGVTGAGALLMVELPMLPMRVRGFAERYFPDCGSDPDGEDQTGCSYWGGGLDALLTLPIAGVEPYVSAGIVYRFLDIGDFTAGDEQIGVAFGGGLSVPAGPVSLFGEGRYEMIEFDAFPGGLPEPVEAGWTFRAGILLQVL